MHAADMLGAGLHVCSVSDWWVHVCSIPIAVTLFDIILLCIYCGDFPDLLVVHVCGLVLFCTLHSTTSCCFDGICLFSCHADIWSAWGSLILGFMNLARCWSRVAITAATDKHFIFYL